MVMLIFVITPQVVMNIVLMLLGTKLILATVGFLDILLNAVALEFVLNLTELFFSVFVPRNQQILVENLAIPEASTKGIATVILVIAAPTYAFLHMFVFQT